MISPSQRPLPDNTQYSQQTNIHAPGGIRTHNLSRRAAEDLHLIPRGHWDRLFLHLTTSFQLLLLYSVDICNSVSKLTNWTAYGIKLSTFFRYSLGNFLLWMRNDPKPFIFAAGFKSWYFCFLVCQSMTFHICSLCCLCARPYDCYPSILITKKLDYYFRCSKNQTFQNFICSETVK